jgi:hypothetical protein
MSTPSTPSAVTPIAPPKSGAVVPGAGRRCTVCRLWVICCVPPPVSKLNDASPGVDVPIVLSWL